MKIPTVFIVTDAFRSDYINAENTPYIWRLGQEGIYVKKLRPSFGFCERTEMFTGTRPDVNGYFNAITYDKGASEFSSLEREVKMLAFLDKFKKARLYIRLLLRRYYRNIRHIKQPIYHIPMRLLPLVALTEDWVDQTELGGLGVESIFDVMYSHGKSFYYDTFCSLMFLNGTDEDRVTDVINHVNDGYDLYLVYLGEGDRDGHYYGPQSRKVWQGTVQRQDARINKIYQGFTSVFQQVNFVIIGDHGMLEVNHHVDIEGMVRSVAEEHNLENGKDFLMLLDSTMARFWFFSDAAEQGILEVFGSNEEMLEHGYPLTQDLAHVLHIPVPGEKHGEFIWLANPGTMIFPDYYNPKPKRGMHGYDTRIDGQKGYAVVMGNKVERQVVEEAELIDICPTLCDLLEIPYPAQNYGRSLIENK